MWCYLSIVRGFADLGVTLWPVPQRLMLTRQEHGEKRLRLEAVGEGGSVPPSTDARILARMCRTASCQVLVEAVGYWVVSRAAGGLVVQTRTWSGSLGRRRRWHGCRWATLLSAWMALGSQRCVGCGGVMDWAVLVPCLTACGWCAMMWCGQSKNLHGRTNTLARFTLPKSLIEVDGAWT